MTRRCLPCLQRQTGDKDGWPSALEAMDRIGQMERYELEKIPGAKETDFLFLKGVMEDPVVRSIVNIQERLEKPPFPENVEPVSTGNTKLAKDISSSCKLSSSLSARELAAILNKPHVKALLETHDTVAVCSRNSGRSVWESTGSQLPLVEEEHNEAMTTQTIRVVGLRKKPNEPLGLTVEVDPQGNLIVARILAGSTIEKQGLLKPGDAIIEVNGAPVATPEELKAEVCAAKDNLTFRVVAGSDIQNHLKSNQTFMKALFDYDPHEDSLLPCKEIGLEFKHGEILQIVDTKDPNWWQAKKVSGDGKIGLIPSEELEERRKAFVKPEADYVHKISICGTRISRKKRKIIYQSKSNNEFDKAELLLYEEVALMPPFHRRTLALVGTVGVGRRTLKNRLINSDPNKFGSVVPMTSRPQRELEENGQSYWFISREQIEKDIREHQMLEYGEHNRHLYGTSLDKIREVINQGKMCILDCSPGALKILHNSSEFMPYVIFIAAPGMELLKQLYDFGRSTGASNRSLAFDRQSSIRYSSRRARTLESLASLYEEDDLKRTVEESSMLQRAYEKYIDLVIVNEDFDITFRKVIEALEELSSKHQWVPANWVYSS
ncbi:MAGUK p55 subfamily member 6 isoform X2 [Cimex lectularius]|uniref:MAGUK p55 subfamily member 6 n=1 Tax=Cimex lectularius TaxID=79782 RepID=A0A8I6RT82_CIMLE|nr:MAGUK p55 subfamily member 6 isoform X2 [Cimex lectularius]